LKGCDELERVICAHGEATKKTNKLYGSVDVASREGDIRATMNRRDREKSVKVRVEGIGLKIPHHLGSKFMM